MNEDCMMLFNELQKAHKRHNADWIKLTHFIGWLYGHNLTKKEYHKYHMRLHRCAKKLKEKGIIELSYKYNKTPVKGVTKTLYLGAKRWLRD